MTSCTDDEVIGVETIWRTLGRTLFEGGERMEKAKVICTKTGGCEAMPSCLSIQGPNACPYYVRTGLVEVIDWREKFAEAEFVLATRGFQYDDMEWSRDEYADAFSNAIAAFEELAGEHRELLEADGDPCVRMPPKSERHMKLVEVPEAAPEQVSVRPYVRAKPRRSKSVSNSPTPTTEIPPAVSESPASLQGQPQPFSDGVTVWYCEGCGKPTDIYPCRVCGCVPTSDDVVTVSHAEPVSPNGESAAVCRWEVGRWGI